MLKHPSIPFCKAGVYVDREDIEPPDYETVLEHILNRTEVDPVRTQRLINNILNERHERRGGGVQPRVVKVTGPRRPKSPAVPVMGEPEHTLPSPAEGRKTRKNIKLILTTPPKDEKYVVRGCLSVHITSSGGVFTTISIFKKPVAKIKVKKNYFFFQCRRTQWRANDISRGYVKISF